MLSLLLDEHLSPRLATQIQARRPGIKIASIAAWLGGRLRGASDETLLAEAAAQHWTLVTYDQSTIVPLLREWAEQGMTHGGVILIDDRTIAPQNLGGLTRALLRLWDAEKNHDWANVVVYLTR